MPSSKADIQATPPKHPKVASFAEIARRITALRKERPGVRIVFTNGCFDILHPGHADLLGRCAAEGDILVVGVNADASVVRLKGPSRPVNTLAARMYILACLECTDIVVPFEEDTPYELIKGVQPDVLIKGGDWSVDKIVGRDIVAARGGSVLSLPLLSGWSTTGMIEKICATSSSGR
jgi:rfaE bifunctional protein nucleotidyltransferase chain/domain